MKIIKRHETEAEEYLVCEEIPQSNDYHPPIPFPNALHSRIMTYPMNIMT